MRENYQIGDYPQVPFVSRQVRNPYLYEDLAERRNFGEDVCFLIISLSFSFIKLLFYDFLKELKFSDF